MVDLDDLMHMEFCEECGCAFMPTEAQIESYLITRYCKRCNNEKM